MKVFDLIENDEWTSNSTDLPFLYKRYKALVHQFAVELFKQFKLHPDEYGSGPARKESLAEALMVYRIWLFETKRINNRVVLHSCRLTYDTWKRFPILETKWNRVVEAQAAFENAGGIFSGGVN